MLVAARDVFEAKGYRAATVGAITVAADTAHGTFYLYFKNKDDAFAQVMAAVCDELREAQRALLAPERYEGVEGVVRGFLGVFVEHPGLWRALLEGMLASPAVEQVWWEMRTTFVDRIAHRLAREQEVGAVRALDAREAALALGSMAEWYAFTHLVLGDGARPAAMGGAAAVDGVDPTVGAPGGPEALDEAVRTLTDLWYHAVYGTTDRSVARPVASA